VKSRPPENRAPLDDEIETCTSNYLQKQISMIKPKLVVALGRISARELLGRPVAISKEHGTTHNCTYSGVKFKLFLSYHPAAALYGAEARQRLLADFRKISGIKY
jgi:DNA polymerase